MQTTPHSSTRSALTPSVISAALILSIANLFYNTLPVVMGSAADSLALVESQIGYLGAVYMAGSAVSSVIATFWIRRLKWRFVAALTTMLGVASCLLAMRQPYSPLLANTFFLGVLNASVVACTMTALGDAEDHDRAFGLGIGLQIVIGGVGTLLLPVLIVPTWGFAGVMMSLAVSFAASLLLIRWLPNGHPEDVAGTEAGSAGSFVFSNSLLLAIGGTLVFYIGQSSIWTFLERISVGRGFSPAQSGLILGLAVILSAVGAFVASYVAERFGRAMAILGATIAIIAVLILLPWSPNVWLFGLVVLSYAICWNFLLPFQYAIVAEADESGRFIPLIPACQLAGSAIGPAIAGNLIFDGDYSYVYLMAMVTAVVSMVLFIRAQNHLPQLIVDAAAEMTEAMN